MWSISFELLPFFISFFFSLSPFYTPNLLRHTSFSGCRLIRCSKWRRFHMAATKPTRLYLSGDHPGKYQPSYLSNGDGASEDMYQPNAAASATYMKFLHLVDTQLSDDERSVSPPPPPSSSSSTHQTTSTDNAQTSGKKIVSIGFIPSLRPGRLLTPTSSFYSLSLSLSLSLSQNICLILPLSPPAYDAVSPEGGDTPVYQDPAERARQEREWQEELVKVEGEILTLRQVLTAKVRQATELKRKLGITPMQEFKQDIQAGFQQLRESGTNSQTFKNVEEKVETAYANVKARVKGSKSDNSIDEAFQAASAPTTPRSEENPPLPEEKFPFSLTFLPPTFSSFSPCPLFTFSFHLVSFFFNFLTSYLFLFLSLSSIYFFLSPSFLFL
ncbi:unnamed protein product [Acanthosepion pharaonis]|uniref:Uncharacterized protein n=1 Tax=Acanthosepion pharaonis TaxID=158019 RepID=A0A812D5Q5_ACAPH|nr:unnamed protein product [Sepia pharaonis]